MILPISETKVTDRNDDVIIGRYLSNGVDISCTSVRRLLSLAPQFTKENIETLCDLAGCAPIIAVLNKETEVNSLDKSFRLHGRKQLETFFNEQIIDVVENLPQYEKLGISFPSAFIAS